MYVMGYAMLTGTSLTVLVLYKIAFLYYPLDLSRTSNPFLVLWWPLALGDPALFHVSLQTACLDDELLAQRGFQKSDILMADSVELLRRKVEDVSLAVQDSTMNSVITLAAIEVCAGEASLLKAGPVTNYFHSLEKAISKRAECTLRVLRSLSHCGAA